MFTRDHIFGFLAGLGVGAVGLVLYRKHQVAVDAFLAGKGIELPGPGCAEQGSLDTAPLEDLVARKERIEDLIAEREHASGQLS